VSFQVGLEAELVVAQVGTQQGYYWKWYYKL